MAQLIKLQDYVSRYESDLYKYPGRYIRLKQSNWQKTKQLWEHQLMEPEKQEYEEFEDKEDKDEAPRWKRLFKKKSIDTPERLPDLNEQLPESLTELKQSYLDKLMGFQLKWASTTLREKSFLDHTYRTNEWLKYFLQRFPDTYLVMYQPIVQIKKAPMEIDLILIGPLGMEIIHIMTPPATAKLVPHDDRTWYIEEAGIRTSTISPLISLKRSETFVKSVLNNYNIDFPYRKVVLAPENEIESSTVPYNTDYIGVEAYEGWFKEKRKSTSPLKHIQLKAAEAMLRHCQTNAIKRPEWELDSEESMMED
ncbi:nuclease-related domain-containing protein [Thalassobacillus hwangdonensis]|uniref:Nuclease-related domain-containing protein n=1 Tax=Thalassobacillus hwangdonensis TaxID=546108 RepID=A0ABW3KYZ2_9BACI